MKTLLAIALLGYVAGGVSNAEAAATLKGRNKVLAECTQQATMGLAKKNHSAQEFHHGLYDRPWLSRIE